MRKLLLAVVVLLVVVAGGLAVVSVAFDRTVVKQHTVAGPVRVIVVRSGAGDVDLVPAAGRLEVRETQHYILTKPKLEQTVASGVLTLSSDCATPVLTCYADLRLTVPAGAEVTVDADSGDVDASAIGARSARVRSDSGDVRLGLVGHQQVARAQTSSGDVDVVADDARAVDAQSNSGDVTVDAGAVPRRVVARTDSGSVTITVPRGTYAVDAKTDSGHVKVDGITLDDRAPNSIEARTSSGDVTVRAG
jgi:DUF4097 and DUF4098 domain-containing protein YvlB